jgi:glycyl-tRNA synthetase
MRRMAEDVVTMDKIVSLCKRRGLIFAASEIYGGIANTYDYGHYGVLLKRNVIDAWWQSMIGDRTDIVALDSAIIQHPKTWEASGHLAGFTDPLVDCKTCGQRFRADHLGELPCGRKPSKHPGETPECDLTEAREFNLMFETTIGPVKEAGATVYLRPETAQGIFLDFKTVLGFARRKPPFGIAQVGKSFRNEITPGNFVFRTLEFEQMEMEFFVPPDEAEQWHEHWLKERMDWYVRLGYRIVQEALTNVARHAGPNAHARVRLARHDGVVEVEVRDDGLGAPAALRPGGGLTGMRERAALLGGRFEAGAAPGGGFRVWASLPVVPR